ncbi:2OG-Fe(II) oxygenase [Nocardia suismassiliense]|uniref:2OG-Fe(II) oxygenase n=1 Tax=Nocardia suismassiliense TaxID=2077092 RepID=UPI00131EFDE0|nr:2OG-Fe(II) oxygenase [Nocardia suismassiliense]
MITTVTTARRPFPFLVSSDAITSEAAASIGNWFATQAQWVHENRGFYRNSRCPNLRSLLRGPARIAVAESTIADLRQLIEDAFDVQLDPSYTEVAAHRLSCGDFIGRHTDQPQNGTETHRAIIHLGGESLTGGTLIIGLEGDQTHIPFQDRLLVAFPLSGQSFHEVSPVESGTRHTLVYSFWAVEATAERPDLTAYEMPTNTLEFLAAADAFRLHHRSKHRDAAATDQHSLGEHLIAVATTLARWRLSEHVVQAGLLHSIYGPLGFSQQLISRRERDTVRAVIGTDAERLAFLFSALDRDSISRGHQRGVLDGYLDDGSPIEVTIADIQAIDQMVWANLLSQRATLDPSSYTQLAQAALGRNSLPLIARDDIRQACRQPTPS